MRPPSFLQARAMQWWGWPAMLVLLIVVANALQDLLPPTPPTLIDGL